MIDRVPDWFVRGRERSYPYDKIINMIYLEFKRKDDQFTRLDAEIRYLVFTELMKFSHYKK